MVFYIQAADLNAFRRLQFDDKTPNVWVCIIYNEAGVDDVLLRYSRFSVLSADTDSYK